MSKSFLETYSEIHAKKFGTQTAKPAPAGLDNLAREIGKAAATA
jgi:hypothetical protein